ncbi:hypothetical protein ACTA71_006987 [Dictyostelium dimigraforme]
MLKRNIIVLFVWILLVSVIKASSPVPSLELIVNSNTNNTYTLECGSSLGSSCNNIPDAINYYVDYIKQNSSYTLVLKLVDGIYKGSLNNFEYSGNGIEISTFSNSSSNVTILGDDLGDDFIEGVLNEQYTLTVSNITFSNFNKRFFILDSIDEKGSSSITFKYCEFKYCSDSFGFTAYSSSPKGSNSITFYKTTFTNLNINAGLITTPNFQVFINESRISDSSMDSLSYEVSSIDKCSISSVSFDDDCFITFRDNIGKSAIENSVFNEINGSKTRGSLLCIYENEIPPIINKNIFTNFNAHFLNSDQGNASFSFNKITNFSALNSPINIQLTSGIYFSSNEINPKMNFNCIFSTVKISNMTNLNNQQCYECIIYNNNDKQTCNTPTPTPNSSDSSPEPTNSSDSLPEPTNSSDSLPAPTDSSTTSTIPSQTTTTNESTHPNGAIENSSISYPLIAIILIVIAILNS